MTPTINYRKDPRRYAKLDLLDPWQRLYAAILAQTTYLSHEQSVEVVYTYKLALESSLSLVWESYRPGQSQLSDGLLRGFVDMTTANVPEEDIPAFLAHKASE